MIKKHEPLEKLNASAGSGKTYALTNRFVNLLFDSDLAPCESCKKPKSKKYNFSELLAITFTNLAANQMKEKVIQILKDYAFKKIPGLSPEDAEEKAKQADAMLETIFQQYGALNIRTIDSLLNQLVGLFALELGYSPQFETRFGTDDLAKELYDALAAQSIGGDFFHKEFTELCENVFFAESSGSSKEYDTFFAKRTVAENILGFVRYSVRNNEYFTEDDIAEAEKNLKFFQKELAESEKKAKNHAVLLAEEIDENSVTVHANLKKALERGRDGDFSSAMFRKDSFEQAVTSKNTADITKAGRLYAKLQKILEQKDNAAVFASNYRTAVPFMKISRAVSLALAAYEKQLQIINSQKMPFIISDILGTDGPSGAQSLAGAAERDFLAHKKQEEVLLSAAFCRLGTRLKHILYDEFQDTSTAQWQALKDLSAEALAGGGSVLFVGDVKQAIYGWRGGKASLFDDAPQSLAQAGRKVYPDNLPYNWRSMENIVEWNNAFFRLLCDKNFAPSLSLLFPKNAREGIPQDMLGEVCRSLAEDYKEVVQKIDRKQLPKVAGRGTAEVHTLHEGEAFYNIAALALLPETVQNLYKRHKEYRRIAVLTVSNKQASWVSQILLQHGIPVVSQGSLGLKEHPVIAEVVGFLRFLANPLDDNAFCQVLLSSHILPKQFYADFPPEKVWDFLAQEHKISLFTVFKKVHSELWNTYFNILVDGADLVTAYDMLCEVYERMAVMENNPDAAVYLLRLRELAHLAEEKGMLDLRAFLDWWDENGGSEKAPLPEGLNSVSVMTIHKSKGLEFDAVIIPWHDFKTDVKGDPEKKDIYKIVLPYKDKNYTVYAPLKREYGEPYYRAVFERIKESINVLYVGWTRAKTELHVFMPAVYNQEEKGAGYFYRFLQAMLTELKASPPEDFVLSEDEDCLRFGEEIEPVLCERSLRALEYAFYDAKYISPEKKDELAEKLGRDITDKLDKVLAEYTEETPKGIKIDVPADDTVFVAKALSRELCPEVFGKENARSGRKGRTGGKFSQKADEAAEKENAETAQSAADTAQPYVQAHSMDWLPQLRIFCSDLREIAGGCELSSNKRGTLIHKSLEFLVFSGDVQEDARRACAEAMKYLPYGRTAGRQAGQADGGEDQSRQRLYEEIAENVAWLASLEEPFGGAELWFEYGYKEHSITDENGSLFRVDLLAEIPEEMRFKFNDVSFVAIDYKTGYLGKDLPVPENERQIRNYIRLLTAATGKKTAGLLIYLDARRCCVIEG